jgi:hypothetical protein
LLYGSSRPEAPVSYPPTAYGDPSDRLLKIVQICYELREELSGLRHQMKAEMQEVKCEIQEVKVEVKQVLRQ